MKKRILFVNDEMVMGGVARILNNLLKMIDHDRYDIDILILHQRGELLKDIPVGYRVIGGSAFFDTIDIPLRQCSLKQLFSKLRLLFYMKSRLIGKKIQRERRKFLKDSYDVEIAFKEGFCTVFTAYGDAKKKLNWVHVDYLASNYSKNHMSLIKKALQKIDLNIAVSDIARDSYKTVFGTDKVITLHNLIDENKIRENSLLPVELPIDENKINLVTAARFHYQKSLDRLIKAYSEVKDKYKLFIIGDGELNKDLHDLAKELAVDDEIEWLGMQTNPFKYERLCDLYVLSSLYEGYPTVVIESLISTTPILSMEVAGIKEQLTKAEYGWIVENNTEALTAKLKELADQKALLQEYKEKLKSYHYENEEILKRIYNLFDEEV